MGNSIVLIAFLWIIRFVLCVQLLNFHFWHCFYYWLSFFENLIQGGAIHGLRKARDILLFNYSIVKGEHYEIRGFYTYENISVNMVLENDIIDDLKSNTKISTISTIAPSVLRHYFKPIDFSHVISKGKGSRILIGFWNHYGLFSTSQLFVFYVCLEKTYMAFIAS